METVKVSSKGQVVIPKSLRESHRIRTGDSLIITAVGDELHLKPAPSVQQSNLKSVAGMLYRAGTIKVSDKQLEKRISARLHDEDKASKSR
jgi:AbrB family looped-hinge helix DNA binding protein